jgi:hypothetical protein
MLLLKFEVNNTKNKVKQSEMASHRPVFDTVNIQEYINEIKKEGKGESKNLFFFLSFYLEL